MPGFTDAVPNGLDLDRWEQDLLIELLQDRLDGIRDGSVSGFGQPADAEATDTRKLLEKVEAAR